jgi:hypothetical protein
MRRIVRGGLLQPILAAAFLLGLGTAASFILAAASAAMAVTIGRGSVRCPDDALAG